MLSNPEYTNTILYQMQHIPKESVNSALITYLKEMHVKITH